jgi:hypothetical protein
MKTVLQYKTANSVFHNSGINSIPAKVSLQLGIFEKGSGTMNY